MISNFQSHVIVNDLGWGDRILANFALSGIATVKKWRDRLLCLLSRIQKMQIFSESDRRGLLGKQQEVGGKPAMIAALPTKVNRGK